MMGLRPRTAGNALAVAVAMFIGLAPAPAQTVRLVDVDATLDPHDGSTWCHAYLDLADALNDALPGDEIRVAAGTYMPKIGTGRLKTFQLKSGVAIYGGFAGCGEPDENARDFTTYETILSGDLDGNDDPTPASNCCTANGTQTCDDAACVTNVCAVRESCCTASTSSPPAT